jgi:plastocyanin
MIHCSELRAISIRKAAIAPLCCLLTWMFASPLITEAQTLEVTARVQISGANSPGRHGASLPPAVLWLQPVSPEVQLKVAVPATGGYTLLQKNKMFTPHLLVVPTGSVVLFPNADPFFHNVFSLFDGKRFDLGLYEAGKTKAVTFSREGVSYIFCNIHSEMSAVVISLSTPLYSIAASDGSFHIAGVPTGDYEMHLWVEGEQQATLDKWTKHVHISSANRNFGTVMLDVARPGQKHTNKFGQPYDPTDKPQY